MHSAVDYRCKMLEGSLVEVVSLRSRWSLGRVSSVGVFRRLISVLRFFSDDISRFSERDLSCKRVCISLRSPFGCIVVLSRPWKQFDSLVEVSKQLVKNQVSVDLRQIHVAEVILGRLHLHRNISEESYEVEVNHGPDGYSLTERELHRLAIRNRAVTNTIDSEVTVFYDSIHSRPEVSQACPCRCRVVVAESTFRNECGIRSESVDEFDVAVHVINEGHVL